MLTDFRNKIDILSKMDFADDLFQIIVANEDILVNMQRDQWSKGTDRNKQQTTLDGDPNYAFATINHKAKNSGLGAVTDYITGFDTGALYNYTFLDIAGDQFAFESDVIYWDDLVLRTGDMWPGLDEDHRKQFATDIVIPTEQNNFKERMGFK
jgi:hypothetical protein